MTLDRSEYCFEDKRVYFQTRISFRHVNSLPHLPLRSFLLFEASMSAVKTDKAYDNWTLEKQLYVIEFIERWQPPAGNVGEMVEEQNCS